MKKLLRAVLLMALLFALPAAAQTECWRGGFVAGGPNDYPHMELWNPVDSGRRLEVLQLYFTNVRWSIGVTANRLPTPANPVPIGANADRVPLSTDAEGYFALDPACIGEIRVIADPTPVLLAQLINGEGVYNGPFRFVLSPGMGLIIRSGDQGTSMRGGFRWRVLPRKRRTLKTSRFGLATQDQPG